MKKVQISYVAYFNKKYDRCGHLFQDRFRSEPVNDDCYFMSVIRYIHQNPIVAGVTDSLKYKWSSYEEYLGKRGFLDRSPISLFIEEGGFVEYHRQQGKEDENRHMRAYLPRSHISDARASALIKARFGFNVFSRIESAERYVRDILLSAIKELGYPIRQLARLTGLGRRVIQAA